jgi:hypothetical protein
MLLTGSEDEFCELLSALFQAVDYHLPIVSLSSISSLCLLKVSMEINSFSSPFLWCTFSAQSLLLCLSFQFLVYSAFFFFFFFAWKGSVCPGDHAGLSQGLIPEGILHDTWCSPVGLRNVSQAGLEPAFDGTGALLFSQ